MNRNTKDLFFVIIQLILFVTYFFRIGQIDFGLSQWLQYFGLIIVLGGIVITVASLLAINRNLSIFPTPKETAELIQSKIYKYIRHPIYTGVIFIAFGYASYSENTLRILISILLLVLFKFKASYEEILLQGKFSNYAEYKKTTGMFFPKLGPWSKK